MKQSLLLNIKRRLTSQPVKIRSGARLLAGFPYSVDIEVACYSSEGVDAVKEALKHGLTLSTEEQVIKINLIAPPLYVVTTTSLDKDKGIKLLDDV